MALTLHQLLEDRPVGAATGPAIVSPGRDALTDAGLLDQVQRVGAALRSEGIGPNSDVAIVVSNGPEMALAFLGVACWATAAPLNPRYGASEFEFYLSDLDTKAVIIEEGLDCAAWQVARRLDIPIILLRRLDDAPAGVFELVTGGRAAADAGEPAQSGDTALILHTSGTTGRPKIVPLTHANLCAAALGMGETYRLTAADRFFSVMPLFHIQGLTSLTAALASGGSVAAAPGFFQREFFEWMDEFRPTWYTASPAVHQFVLSQAAVHADKLARCSLRFIRSSAAPLPPAVMLELERTFGVPVLEGYGMTETCLHAASNPLPPGHRKPGAVGRPTTGEIKVVDASGNAVAPGERGEILFRGPSVIRAYRAAPEVNERSFLDGWLRSGDEGYFDSDGDLHITGRLKEMINRGGEKIAPREIDEVLLEHPDVSQAVAFAVHDAAMGEEIGVAVKLRGGATMTEQQVRACVGAELAYFKIPRYVVFVDEIPKGPTGKLQRIGLAERLGVSAGTPVTASPHRPPAPGLESGLVRLWKEVLEVDRVGVADDFFSLGGSSVIAVELFARMERELSATLPLATLFEAPTVEQLARRLEVAKALRFSSLVALQRVPVTSRRTPLFLVHAGRGNVLLYRDLVRLLGAEQLVFGFQSPGLDGRQEPLDDFAAMADLYVREMKQVQPTGPYLLAGHCMGAYLAHEMAVRLTQQGETVSMLAIFDTDAEGRTVNGIRDVVRYHWRQMRGQPWRAIGDYIAGRIQYRFTRLRYRAGEFGLRLLGRSASSLPFHSRAAHIHALNFRASENHELQVFPGDVLLFHGSANQRDPRPYWSRHVAGRIEIREVPGKGKKILHPPNVSVLADHLRGYLQRTASITAPSS